MGDLPCARRAVSQSGSGAFLFVWALWGPILLVPTALSLMAIAVPFALAAGWFWTGDFLNGFLRQFCHQMPSRSLWMWGYPFGLCIRSLAIYTAFVVIGWKIPFGRFRGVGIPIATALVLPMLADVALQVMDVWAGANWVRGLTGMLFGVGSAFLLWAGVWAVALRVDQILSALTGRREVVHP